MKAEHAAIARVAVMIIALGFGANRAEAADCHALAGTTIGDATIVETDDVAAPLTISSLDGGRAAAVRGPFCRIRGDISPTADSDIRFELWLPPSMAWNGRFQGIGNGGFAGSIHYAAMSNALQEGYVVAATDTGHYGKSGDSRWALGHPEKIEDLGWRSIHETAITAKAIIALFYGKGADHSYFNGCSTGGRQALLEAQRFPEDYDGIVAGAPAIFWPRMHAAKVLQLQYISKPEYWVSPDKLKFLNNAVLAACGSHNGVLTDPYHCNFNTAKLLCKAGQSSQCLTPNELTTVTIIYSGIKGPDGKSFYPGFPMGSEAAWRVSMGPTSARFAESSFYPMPTGFYGNLVYQNPHWDFRTASTTDLIGQANNRAVKAVYSESPDLSAFEARGGKLIHYHGWNDPSISALGSIKYYESVAAAMGGRKKLDPFYRLFLAPGMEHCGGGPGPTEIGGPMSVLPPSHDPQHDVVAAVAEWVEHGVAPQRLIATKYRDGDPVKGIIAQRPWCPFPSVAQLKNGADPTSANSFLCKIPANSEAKNSWRAVRSAFPKLSQK